MVPDHVDHASHARTLADAFEAHHAMLHRRLIAWTHDDATADDLVQDAFARLLFQICAEREPDNVGGWLHRAAIDLAASRARHEEVERRYAPALQRTDIVESSETAVEGAEQVRRLRAAVRGLPAQDRVLILLAANGARGPQLAARIGRSEPAARTALCRACGRLRLALATA
jgi:RNA polymerase sigma factor (sigma-70 family)